MTNKYEEMVVTFIDILGFKNLIKSKDLSEIRKIIEQFNLYKNLSRYCHKTGNPNNDTFNSISASDAIIRFTRFPNKCSSTDVFIKELEILAHIQLKLICDFQILIRGGLTIGQMYFNYNDRLSSFFGPAYIRAYEIETNIASYPRIVIDNSLNECFKITNNYISLGKDGELFIDYLENSRINHGFTEFYLINHKKSIIQLILLCYIKLGKYIFTQTKGVLLIHNI